MAIALSMFSGLVDYFLFNHDYRIESKSLINISYYGIVKEGQYLMPLEMDLDTLEIEWLKKTIDDKSIKTPLLEKKGTYPKRIYRLDYKDGRSKLVTIYENGKVIFHHTYKRLFEPVDSITYLSKEEMDHLDSFVGK